jgi:hypothetical protein
MLGKLLNTQGKTTSIGHIDSRLEFLGYSTGCRSCIRLMQPASHISGDISIFTDFKIEKL